MSPLNTMFLMVWQVIFLICKSSLDLCAALLRNLLSKRKKICRSLRVQSRRGVAGTSRYLRRSSVRSHWYALAEVGVPRRWWVYPRSKNWWEQFIRLTWDEEQWIERFRMSRGTFFEIVEALRPHLQRQTTNMREPIPVEKRVAIAIWYLANANCYREVREQFGVGLSTVGEIVLEVCCAMELDLLRKTVCLGNEIAAIMDGFAHLGFPHCIGAIDGMHILIRAPGGRMDESGNCKKNCSIFLQGTVDHTGRFINAEVGWSGRSHDAFIFQNSALCTAMDAGVFVPGNPTLDLNGVQVPALMVADGAYPIRRWLMKPFGKNGDTRRRTFDHALHRVRNVVECAFGRLKARWRCLTMRLPVFEENITTVITACVILHNICEEKGHGIVVDLCDSVSPPVSVDEEDYYRNDNCQKEEGKRVRDAVADFILSHQPCP
ncbi:protein ANTAGONIST OF LIKE HETEROCHROMATIN PROTEIN 1-like [Sphaerodactylus townsendi]|uniref:protein ANTAGONIST OF LIKE HETEROCHROMATIN PROTEIN 1-like n=1 Tax=Sphaerodactylus townsendi TaxID=933632 RepID=UPI00202620A0|nr:protein ANTAGONIST OF LIKE HETEROCHROMATIN PROTEIN 1-like [Sphaerodactylus townsendi]XP_048373459.1 protein ANTAGONIST OF LIKE HETEROCHROMATIN PROTEIN 1-like [Sphaerodactylus townsendi]XP_048373469.1 protein ANTAGONIST OF LIKE HETEROCHROMATIN PROTEIN 1-like [Sphaerodactylus townsendi]XP_048373478.1 protein ANTAGONIST OF LIKE HETEROCHROMATIN PROTEIN 1-like [Sphaerodactylus townsendi]